MVVPRHGSASERWQRNAETAKTAEWEFHWDPATTFHATGCCSGVGVATGVNAAWVYANGIPLPR